MSPKVVSLFLKHYPNAPLPGLKLFPRDLWAPVPIVLWSLRIMVALGFEMLGLGLFSLVARWRHQLYDWSWLHRAAIAKGPAGFVGVIAGWVTTEDRKSVVYGKSVSVPVEFGVRRIIQLKNSPVIVNTT